jgi:hypothetical protein
MTYIDLYDVSGANPGTKYVFTSFDVSFVVLMSILIIIIFVSKYTESSKKVDITSSTNDNIQHSTESTINSSTESAINADTNSSESAINADTNADTNSSILDNTTPGVEPFTNDLPYQLKNESIKLNPDMDYSEILKNMSLDQDVITQHNQYVNDRNKITSTASFAPSRSDNQDIVTTWGLTKPKYVNIDSSARNVPSQDPEQGSKPITLQWK